MDALTIFFAALALLILLLIIEVPVGLSLVGASVVGIMLARGSDVAMATLGQLPFNTTTSYSLAVVPLYILTGALATKAGIASDLFAIAKWVFQRVPGGVGLSGVAGSAGFAAVTGSSVATVASVGKTSIVEMMKQGYSPGFASGIIASAGTLGILIPPSVMLVMFGITTGTSIGSLLIAGIVPGIISAVVIGVAVLLFAHFKPSLVGDSSRVSVPRPGKRAFAGLLKVTILFIVIIGGVYGGWYTVTEAGAVGVLVAFAFAVTSKQNSGGRLRSCYEALVDAARMTSGLFMIVVGGALFTYLIVSLRIPTAFADWATGLAIPPMALVGIILVMLIPLGMVLDGMSIVLVFIPIVFPIVAELGFSDIWFAVLTIKMIEIGLLTPPVGLNAFVVSASVPSIPVSTVFRGVLPFILVDLALVAIFFAFPDVITFLPERMA